MAVKVLYQADILLDGVAASTESNKVKVSYSQEVKDFTAFQDTNRKYLPSLATVQASAEGYYQTGAGLTVNLLESKFPALSSFTATTVTIGDTTTVGDFVDIFQAVPILLEYAGKDGEILPFSFDTRNAGARGGVRATRLFRSSLQTASSNQGTAVNLGAVTATQGFYAALHILQTTGTTAGVAFSLISAASSSLTGATTRYTFTPGTSAVGAQFVTSTSAGAITDTWWALSWAGFPAGATQGFTASLSVGIQ